VVRLVLVPAVMELLGPANWWLPGWLARLLPVKGSGPADRSEDRLAPEPADVH
jgi:putative drug exporter of the RND superfamily